jgi:hypothetical protein
MSERKCAVCPEHGVVLMRLRRKRFRKPISMWLCERDTVSVVDFLGVKMYSRTGSRQQRRATARELQKRLMA